MDLNETKNNPAVCRTRISKFFSPIFASSPAARTKCLLDYVPNESGHIFLYKLDVWICVRACESKRLLDFIEFERIEIIVVEKLLITCVTLMLFCFLFGFVHLCFTWKWREKLCMCGLLRCNLIYLFKIKLSKISGFLMNWAVFL